MTGHPPEAAWWDEERNGWVHPGGLLVPAELVGGRDLPDQHDRAAPFGIAYEVDDEQRTDYACTCSTELVRLHSGAPLMWARFPDPTDPCPIPGHDQPERRRYARH